MSAADPDTCLQVLQHPSTRCTRRTDLTPDPFNTYAPRRQDHLHKLPFPLLGMRLPLPVRVFPTSPTLSSGPFDLPASISSRPQDPAQSSCLSVFVFLGPSCHPLIPLLSSATLAILFSNSNLFEKIEVSMNNSCPEEGSREAICMTNVHRQVDLTETSNGSGTILPDPTSDYHRWNSCQ